MRSRTRFCRIPERGPVTTALSKESLLEARRRRGSDFETKVRRLARGFGVSEERLSPLITTGGITWEGFRYLYERGAFPWRWDKEPGPICTKFKRESNTEVEMAGDDKVPGARRRDGQ
jgi:hypothetical protein